MGIYGMRAFYFFSGAHECVSLNTHDFSVVKVIKNFLMKNLQIKTPFIKIKPSVQISEWNSWFFLGLLDSDHWPFLVFHPELLKRVLSGPLSRDLASSPACSCTAPAPYRAVWRTVGCLSKTLLSLPSSRC